MTKRRRRTRRRASNPATTLRWAALGLAGAVLFFAGLYLGAGGLAPSADDSAEPPAEGQTAAEASSPSSPARGTTAQARPPAADPSPGDADVDSPLEEQSAEPIPPMPPIRPVNGRSATVALVIDDLGRSLDDLDRLRALGVPVTYAVLPFEARTAEVDAVLARRGEEVLLHLPMEPSGGADPGPGALTRTMSDGELVASTRDALRAVPSATGVNNHMGSELSSDRRAMNAVLGEIGSRSLFFLDSRTSSASVGYRAAQEMGIPAAERQVFLDTDADSEAIRREFRRLLALAAERGSAIAIGHPYPATLEILAQEVPRAREAGYEFVPVSYLLDRSTVAAR